MDIFIGGKMINLMIVDDQPIMVEGLKMILSSEEELTVVATAKNGKEAIDKVRSHNPDVILMDIQMEVMNGIEAAKIIKRDYPNIKVILLTTFNDDAYIKEGFSLGIDGYALKDAQPKEIFKGIKLVISGGVYIDSNVAKRVIAQLNHKTEENTFEADSRVEMLTNRELEIVKMIGLGKNNLEISEELFLSEGTVKNHLTKILDKLELRDRTQVAIFAIKNKLIN